MSLYDDAVLVMIPSAFKATKLYSVKPTDAAGDFTVANAGAKFRTNSDLKLEEIAENVPALDYDAVGGCPTLKLNEANTNLLERPLSFGHSYWDKSGSTIEGDASTAGGNLITSSVDNTLSSAIAWSDAATFRTAFNLAYTWDMPQYSGLSTADVTANVMTMSWLYGRGIELPILTIGKIYECTINVSAYSGTILYIGSMNNGNSVAPDANYAWNVDTTGVKTFQFVASTTNFSIRGIGGTPFSYSIDGSTIISVKEVTGYPSPSVTYPTDAYLFTATAGDGSIKLTTPLASAAYNNSWYVKRATGTGVVSLVDASDTDIEIAVTGGWQRFDANATGTQCGLKLADSGDAVYIAFAQTSAKTYAPTFTYSGTEGAESSMLADAITGGGDAATFASVNASGVLYGEVLPLADGRFVLLKDASNYIALRCTPTQIAFYSTVGGVAAVSLYDNTLDISSTSKIAIRWGLNDFSIWLDGVKIKEDITASTGSGLTFSANTLTTLQFKGRTGGDIFYGNAKQVAVYNYLSDSQMSELTTP